jgi:hypothetical protein
MSETGFHTGFLCGCRKPRYAGLVRSGQRKLKRAATIGSAGATPTVRSAPSRGHSWTISTSAAERQAAAGTQARHQRRDPAGRLVVGETGHVLDDQRQERAAAQRQLGGRQRDLERAPLLLRAFAGAQGLGQKLGLDQQQRSPAARHRIAQPGRAEHDHRGAIGRPAQQRLQRWLASERT